MSRIVIFVLLATAASGVSIMELKDETRTSLAKLEETIGEIEGLEFRLFYMSALEAGAAEDLLIVINAFSEEIREKLSTEISPVMGQPLGKQLEELPEADEARIVEAVHAIEPLIEPARLDLCQAGAMYYQGEYLASGEAYERAFEAGLGNRLYYYNAACSWALAGEKDAAFENLDRAVDAGWYALQASLKDEDLAVLHDDPRWSPFVSGMESRIDELVAALPESQDPILTVELPEPSLDSETSVEEAMAGRRSVREYAKAPLTLGEVSQLLWAAYGITRPIPDAPAFLRGGLKTAPSAGARYPLEIYLVAGDVEGLDPGVYWYGPETHVIHLISRGDVREELMDAAVGQVWVREAPASLVYSAVFERTMVVYGDRGRERYVPMDAGHSAENVYLQCASLGLGTVAIGAFVDTNVKLVTGMTRPEEPLYILPVGRKIGE
jgi:SagB-type dehydrogenase family enzyme